MNSTPAVRQLGLYIVLKQTSYDPQIVNARALGRDEMMGEIINCH